MRDSGVGDYFAAVLAATRDVVGPQEDVHARWSPAYGGVADALPLARHWVTSGQVAAPGVFPAQAPAVTTVPLAVVRALVAGLPPTDPLAVTVATLTAQDRDQPVPAAILAEITTYVQARTTPPPPRVAPEPTVPPARRLFRFEDE
jgi:hypothetical protein